MLGGSVQLVRLFGIRIGASPSWFVVLFLFIYLLSDHFERLVGAQGMAYALAVASALLFFASLVLHELGHALVARRLGMEISGIDLWFFGGIARMRQDTTSPGAEFRVAAAGPAVTLAVVALCLGLALAVASGGDALRVALLAQDARTSPVLALLGFLATINAFLFLFNLIPAFPLDGGRIARAVVWRLTGDRGRATRLAGRLGQGFAVLLIGLGAYLALRDELFNGLYLGLLGWFLFSAARSAVASTALSERLEGITVADVMEPAPLPLSASAPVEQALGVPGPGWTPVVDERGRFLGVLPAERVRGAAVGALARELLDGDADAWQVSAGAPVESLLADERLGERGALVAVDRERQPVGILTAHRVRRAIAIALSGR
ncbi:MAG: site-2 protease family protein [Actinomycetota bacterium]|nr:site-2 protease family protein [Actinomycetota bacterium]